MDTADHSPQSNLDLNRKLRQLESIAALSGGIAHDYNNLLTAIMGNISLAMDHIASKTQVSELLEQALAATRMAKTLTRTLITFSKGGVPAKIATDVVGVVKDVAAFSLSGSNIRCELASSADIWPANADPEQVGQAVHNLMVNAAESMPSGGRVLISFENTIVDSPNSILAPGRYVDITIKDEGVGIPTEHIDRIFDPYFSTKAKGSDRGTGLGLSISHSIVAKHGGDITVCSRLGTGTTFHVLLPASKISEAVAPTPCQVEADAPASEPVYGRGRILVMDDEAMIRELAGKMLVHLGYEADFAEAGQEAVDKYQAARDRATPYDAVILDLTIKGGMGGKETMAMLQTVDPAVKAIVSSGYSDDPVIANYQHFGFCDVVAKPYEMIEFSQKLHRVVNLP